MQSASIGSRIRDGTVITVVTAVLQLFLLAYDSCALQAAVASYRRVPAW